jgi:CRISPR-associated protein Cas5d
MRGKTHCLEVWGEFACFTRPEMKVERYSYPVITPSAARGIFDAIYWKKSYHFYWQIEKVEVLAPPRYIALRRNEVKGVAQVRTIQQWRPGHDLPTLYADDMDDETSGRTQRQTMALKNVHYRIYAHMNFRDAAAMPVRHDEQFERRLRQGKCFYQPYFGCREFPAYFREGSNATAHVSRRADYSADLGIMIYDIFNLSKISEEEPTTPFVSVFHAEIIDGTMLIPPFESDQVLKPVRE